MAGNFAKVRGTADLLPASSYRYQQAEQRFLKLAQSLGFREIRVPTFEKTALFCRSSGETSDVVSKEMYSFTDKGGDELTLRPEGTAGVVRSAIENGLINDALPQKLCYLLSCFRYNRPQAGRLREFHQFGVEILGADSYLADAEIIFLANRIFEEIGIAPYVTTRINSIGCPECRKEYVKALKEYFQTYCSELCNTCNERLEKNPMRILDCKAECCKALAAKAPKTTDYLCDKCRAQLDGLMATLDDMGIRYELDSMIVRGLDYYNGPVFEFVTEHLGAQSAVGGGGRYDGLVEELGGPHTAALGFGLGIERMMLLAEKVGVSFDEPAGCTLFIIPMGERAKRTAASAKCLLQRAGIACETELVSRSLKASMRYANKIGAGYTLVLGDDELDNARFTLKPMNGGDEIVTDDLAKLAELLK
ncbi:MAG: histidine--tRNA ligase [Clostridia bacterium]|nr:histidine--tRNA ligase [Clostridia bacterium]